VSRTEPDATRIVRLWLEEGVTALPDHVLDAVLDQLPATSQRRPTWLARRSPFMSKFVGFGLAAAAVVILAVIGIQLIGGSNPGGPPQDPSPSPSVEPSVAPSAGPSTADGTLGPPGTAVQAANFAEPFTFTVPEFPTTDPPTPVAFVGEGSGPPYQSMRLNSPTWGIVSFHDDQSLPANLCLPTGDRIDDVPATPEAGGDWLASSTGLEVTAAEALDVDGRSALRWDIHLPVGVCDEQSEAMAQQVQPPWFAAGEDHRVYAVPTGADTILVLTWGVSFMGLSEEYGDAVNAATDDLVQSMTFGD
jgi:hypothetical protein